MNLIKVFIFLFCSVSVFCQENENKKSIQETKFQYTFEPTSLLDKTPAERMILLNDYYNDVLPFSDSTNTFKIINRLNKLSQTQNDKDLLLEAELIKVHYYCFNSEYKKNFVINEIEELEKVAKEEQADWLQIRTISLLANYTYSFHQDYGLGFEYFERTIKLLETKTVEEFPLKPLCYAQLGAVYFEFEEYDKALNYYNKATSIESPLYTYYYRMGNLNFLGNIYQKLNILDSSNYYFKKTLQEAKKENDSVWIGISSGNLGHNYFLDKEYEKAKPLLELDAEIAIENKDWGLASNALLYLSKIAIVNSDISKAKSLATYGRDLTGKSNQARRFPLAYEVLAKVEAFSGNPEVASKYLDSLVITKDSLMKRFDSKKILRVQQRLTLEAERLEAEKIQEIQSKKVLRRNGVIALLGLILIVLTLLYNRYQLKLKNRAQLLASEKELAIERLEAASKRLDDYKTSILEKNRTITSLKNKSLPSEKKENNTVSDDVFETSAILTNKEWREFKKRFEDVHPGYFKRLDTTYKNLTPSEIRLFALSNLELENKEIALILGIGPSAVRQSKSRLLKKLNLPSKTNIIKLAQEV